MQSQAPSPSRFSSAPALPAKLVPTTGVTKDTVEVTPNPRMLRPVLPAKHVARLRALRLSAPALKYDPVQAVDAAPSAKGEVLIRWRDSPDAVRAILADTYVHGCPTSFMPHVLPDLPIDVLVVPQQGVLSTRDWRVWGKNKLKGASYCNAKTLVERHGYRAFRSSVCVVAKAPPAPHAEQQGGAHRLLAMFLTDRCDARLAQALASGPRVLDTIASHIQQKDKTRWFSQGDKKNNEHVSGYEGALYNEGVQFYRYGRTNRFGYFLARKDAAPFDDAYMSTVSQWSASLSMLEQAHMPGMHAFRVAKAKAYRMLSVLPGVPLDVVPAHTLGISKGFANDVHNDSTAAGFTESIGYWRGQAPLRLPRGHRWAFCIWRPKVIFDLGSRPASMVYVPGREPHSTLLTGPAQADHPGIGSVLFSRSSVMNSKWLKLSAQHGHDVARIARGFRPPRGAASPSPKVRHQDPQHRGVLVVGS